MLKVIAARRIGAQPAVVSLFRHTSVRRIGSTLEIPPRPGDAAPRTVSVLPGDGDGEEVFAAVEAIFAAASCPIKWEVHHVPEGPNRSMPDAVIQSFKKNGVGLKGVLTTPVRTGYRSLNVALRKQLDLFANVVHVFSVPGIPTRHGDLDFVVIRENTEGEYSGMEHEVQPGVVESLKVITRENSRRIAEYAFEYAYLNHRKKVTAIHKANIMKMADGMFLNTCKEVAKKYPSVGFSDMIVDNACMQMVSNPQQFDVLVMPNLYGNVIGNIGAGLVGGPGLVAGGNVGNDCAIFEQGARHMDKASAAKKSANPTGQLLSAVMMLRYLKLTMFAERIEKAVMKVLKDGKVRTPDIGGTSTTQEFTRAVIANLA